MKMGSSKPDELSSGDGASGAINVGTHRVSYRVEADGSAEAVLSNISSSSSLFTAAPLGGPVPISPTKSTPLGGVSYVMRRVLARNDKIRPVVSPEQEAEGSVTSRVQKTYKRGGVEAVLDNNSSSHSSPPPPLVKTKSALSPSYAIRKVFSKRDGEWSSPSKSREVDDHMSSRVGRTSPRSTPRQVKRSKTSGYEQQSSLFYDDDEEKILNPISLVRSRLSSIGQKVTGGGGKELGKGKDDTVNDDDLSTIEKSMESYYYCFFCGINENLTNGNEISVS